MIDDSSIILFDGVCNLCNGFVQFVIRNDKAKKFKFGSLQSANAQQLLTKYDITNELKTVIFILQGKVYYKSTAALKILKQLNFPLPILYCLILVPKFIRDYFYDIISRNRYKWFGQKETCMIPTPELRSRFIE
jgi:predicted DCC family thiol-disulfide oxidoreductase YuxK